MDAPKCKICGERHYGLCSRPSQRGTPPDLPFVPAPETEGVAAGEMAPNRQLTVEELGGPFIGIIAHETAQLFDPDKPKFDRVAYQREYMRKWRASRKG